MTSLVVEQAVNGIARSIEPLRTTSPEMQTSYQAEGDGTEQSQEISAKTKQVEWSTELPLQDSEKGAE